MSKQLVLCVRCRGWGDVPGAFTYCPECGGFGALFAAGVVMRDVSTVYCTTPVPTNQENGRGQS